MRPFRAVTFDAAGTLLVPNPGVGSIYAEVAASFGLVCDAVELEGSFRQAFRSVQSAWAVPYGADENDARRFWSAVIDATFGSSVPYEISCELYDTFAHPQRWRVVSGASAAISACRARALPISVVSNFDLRLRPLLDGIGLGPFDAIVTSSEVGAAKPDPRVFVEACRRLSVRPDEVLHIGDSEREDGQMCAAAGCQWLSVDPAEGIPLTTISSMLYASW
jgi:putative hydrolase of the HAD superfamily